MTARVLRVVLAAVALVLLLAVSAGATNSSQYTDPAEGGTAPDVIAVKVQNDDNANVTFSLTINGKRLISAGDTVFVFIDADRNPGTGDTRFQGADYYFGAAGSDGTPQVEFCTWRGSWNCAPWTGWGDTVVSATQHVMSFGVRFTTKTAFDFNFFVGTLYTDPATQATTSDLAPDRGSWSYRVAITPDADGDGLRPPADRCPALAGGRYDKNKNGCPGPFQRIQPVFPWDTDPVGKKWLLDKLEVRNIPNGSKVVIAGAGRRETLVASGGKVSSRRFTGRTYRSGTPLEVYVTRPGSVGAFTILRIGRKVTRAVDDCIPAYGDSTPVPCSDALLGK